MRFLITLLIISVTTPVFAIDLSEVLALYAKQQTHYLDTKIQVYEYDWNADGQPDYFMSCDDSVLCESTKNGTTFSLFLSEKKSSSGFVQKSIYAKPFGQFVRLRDGRIALLSTVSGGWEDYSTSQYTINQQGELESEKIDNSRHEYQEIGSMQLHSVHQAVDVLPEADKKIRQYASEDVLNHMTFRSGQRDVNGAILSVTKCFLVLDDGTELYIGDDADSKNLIYPASEETMLQMYYIEMLSIASLKKNADGTIKYKFMKPVAQEWLDQHPESAKLHEKVKGYCWPREACPAGTPKITLEEIFQGKITLAKPVKDKAEKNTKTKLDLPPDK